MQFVKKAGDIASNVKETVGEKAGKINENIKKQLQ